MADETEALHDPNWFQFTGPPFVVAPWPRPTSEETLLKSFARGEAADPEGRVGTFVAVFSDQDLAERFIAMVGAEGKQKPLSFKSLEALVSVLEDLTALGETHIGIDPGEKRVVRISIPRIIEAIRNRKR